ncbi:MAG: hypothetical protein GXO57_00015 [Thermodesulfobacteria bacterium]|nr:hypothetical protein [Thermodesulfobacteriota bacterium]
MFDFLRKSATSPIAKVFLAVIIIVFVFWGVGFFSLGNRNIVAKVNGIPITLKDYEEYYNFELFKLKQAFGELSQEQLKKLGIKQKVLNDLIKIKLLNEKAKELGIEVSPEEVDYSIAKIPSFQVNGKFNYQRFLAVLQDLGISPSFFRLLVKTDLLLQKFKLFLTAPIIASNDEVKEVIRFNKQTLNIVKATLPISYCESKVKVTKEALKSYYLAHRDIYTEPKKVKLYYIFLPFKGKVKVTDKEVEAFYMENLNNFKEPLQVRLRVIEVPYTVKDALKRAQEVRTKLRSLRDFAKFNAKDLGWVEGTAFPPNLRNLLSKLKPGDIVGPIKGVNGYLILGIEAIRPPRIVPLKKVKKEIKNFLAHRKLINQVKEKADSIYTEVISLNGLKSWAKKHHKKLLETGFLDETGLFKKFQNIEVVKKILQGTKGDYFPPIITTKGVYLVEIADVLPPKLIPFKKIIARVKKDFVKDEGIKVCSEMADEVFLKVKKGMPFEKVVKKKGFSVKHMKVERDLLSKKLPLDVAQVLSNTGKPQLILQKFWLKDKLALFDLKDILPFKGKISKTVIERIKPIVTQEKRARWFNKWYQTLLMSSEVKVYPLFKRL